MHLGSSPMFVECMLTMEICNALGVLLGDSRIVDVIVFLNDMKNTDILLW